MESKNKVQLLILQDVQSLSKFSVLVIKRATSSMKIMICKSFLYRNKHYHAAEHLPNFHLSAFYFLVLFLDFLIDTLLQTAKK